MTKSRKMRWVGLVAWLVEGRGVYRVLVGKPEGKRPLERPRRRWEGKIKVDLQGVGCGVLTGLSWLKSTYEYGNEPSGSIKFGEFLD
jgi:hypothetical protein